MLFYELAFSVAETERTNIRQMQKEGIAEDGLCGIRLDCYVDSLQESFFPADEKWSHREITGKQTAEEMVVSFSQFEWMRRKYKKMLMKEHEK